MFIIHFQLLLQHNLFNILIGSNFIRQKYLFNKATQVVLIWLYSYQSMTKIKIFGLILQILFYYYHRSVFTERNRQQEFKHHHFKKFKIFLQEMINDDDLFSIILQKVIFFNKIEIILLKIKEYECERSQRSEISILPPVCRR